MSLCPRRLRFRISYGLQSCAPQCRISLGHWHRPSTKIQVARYSVDDARYSNTGTPGGRHVNSCLETPSIPQNDIVKNARQTGPSDFTTSVDPIQHEITCRTDGNLESSEPVPPHLRTENPHQQPGTCDAIIAPSLPYNKKRMKYRLTPILTISTLKKFLQKEGEPSPKISPSLLGAVARINRETTFLDRRVSRTNLAVEAVNRSRNLYSQNLYSENWNIPFGALYKAKLYKEPLSTPIPGLLEGAWPLIEMINTDHAMFKRTWMRLDKRTRADNWQRLAFWLLQHSPLSMPEFLLNTAMNKHRPNCNMISNCFRYLNKFYPDQMKNWRKWSLTYPKVVQACLSPKTWPILMVPQFAIQTYVMFCDRKALYYALAVVKQRQIFLSAPTVLTFVNRFTYFGDARTAVEVLSYLRTLNDPEYGFDSLAVMRHCAKLLTLDSVETGPNGRNFHILPKLLAMGVRPNRTMMNIVLSNAFKTGDPQLGDDMLNFMKGQDYDFDAYTYSILLRDAVSRWDRERVGRLIQEIDRRPEVRENDLVMSQIIHAHYVFTAKKMDSDAEPARVFYTMLDIYNRLHDLTPLKELFIIPPEYNPPVQGSNKAPSLIALYIMIATYFRCQRRLSSIERVYSRFRDLALEGHPTIAPLAATDHTYNEFLVALRGNPHGLRMCVRIIEDMMQTPSDIQLANDPDLAVTHTKPSVRSWTILLSAFVYNKQPHAAEKVKEMMAKHNVEYNQVVWNTIISGYANAQNIPEAAKAIRMMEKQGFNVDSYTLRSLSYLRDPNRLWVVLDELDKVRVVHHKKSGQPVDPLESEFPAEDEDTTREYEVLLDQGLRRLDEKKRRKAGHEIP